MCFHAQTIIETKGKVFFFILIVRATFRKIASSPVAEINLISGRIRLSKIFLFFQKVQELNKIFSVF